MKNTISRWFEVRAKLSKTEKFLIGSVGVVIIFLSWHLITTLGYVPRKILPNPIDVAKEFPNMFQPHNPKRDILYNLLYSLKINFLGIAESIALSIPIGLAIGLFSPVQAIFGRFTQNLRYLPLTAVVGLFMVNFGTGIEFKVHFLAAGIFVYLMPSIAKRCEEVKESYKNTARTLGASNWEVITTVYFPAVLKKSQNDIINLMAVSWTYIVIVENYFQQAGIGVLAWTSSRMHDYEKVYIILFVIFLVGLFQDWLFKKIFSGIGWAWKEYFNMKRI